MNKIGILYDNISGNTGDQAIGISLRAMMQEFGADFDELIPGRFNSLDYQKIIIGGGYLLQPSPNFFYDKFRVRGAHILNSCGIYQYPDNLDYLNDYSYVSVRSYGDKHKLSSLKKDVKVVPCTAMLLNQISDYNIPNIPIVHPNIGIHLFDGLFEEESLITYLSSLPYNIYFIPITHYNLDYLYLEKISRRIKNSTVLPILSPLEIFTVISKFDFFVSASLHGAMFSYIQNIPFILFNNQDKQNFFMKDRNLENFLFNNIDSLKSTLGNILNIRPDFSNLISHDLNVLREHKTIIKDLLIVKQNIYISFPIENNKNQIINTFQEKIFQIQFLQNQATTINIQKRELENIITEKIIEIEALKEGLNKKIELFEIIIKDKDNQISELQNIISEKNNQINELNKTITTKDNQILQIKNQLNDFQKGIIMNCLKRYERFIENLLPGGSKRRDRYELILKGVRILVNEGWRSFWGKFNYWRKNRYKQTKKAVLPIYKTKQNNLAKIANEILFQEPSGIPEVSIVIPFFNKTEYTINCLHSIATYTRGDFEVILIDDNSTEKQVKILNSIKNITLIKNKGNSGFVESCNKGAKAAKGKYLLFLNNDTTVSENWLQPMIDVIKNEDVGAVGSKLIYPDGKLQEAGAIIWRDGSALGYGRGEDPSKPEFNYISEVDYCSGASLLVKKELFCKIGGFDERFKPAYYEDTDLCMAIRDIGYKIIYQPKSVVIHYEGITSGTDINSGIKQFQQVNKPKFIEKWQKTLNENHIMPNFKQIEHSRNRFRDKNILILDDRIPNPSQGSGFPRAYTLLKIFGEFGYNITFYPVDNTTPWEPYTSELQQMGIEVFFGKGLEIHKLAEKRQNYYDLVLISRPHNMKKLYSLIKKYWPKAIIFYDAEALFSQREILKSRIKGTTLKNDEISKIINEELALIKQADTVITVSENEKRIIKDQVEFQNVIVWGYPTIVNNISNSYHNRKDILFVGGFLGYESPNTDAIIYFVQEIFPKIKEKLDCRLFIVGIDPPDEVKKLSSSSIVVTGFVENIEEYYNSCRVFVVPHRYSAGISLKLIEAMANNIPCVVSELTATQLNLIDNNQVLVGNNSEDFAQKVVQIYNDENLWYNIQRNAVNYINNECNPTILKEALKKVVDAALKPQ